MENFFGIMQGRLLPKHKGKYQAHPVGYWNKEFALASKLGFDCIEFILDFDQAYTNPLLLDSGLKSIEFYIKKYNVLVKSICADYFMVSPIFTENAKIRNENLKILKKLIKNSEIIGVKDIVIPLVDNSSLLNSRAKQISATSFLKEIFEETKNFNINICLETDLPPNYFLDFVKNINVPQIKINYDTGNSASLGYRFEEELELYGDYVTNIHIKDRRLNGGSVPLGLGDCQFQKIFQYLSMKQYDGIFILQAFRDENAVKSLMPQYEFIKNCLRKYYYSDSKIY